MAQRKPAGEARRRKGQGTIEWSMDARGFTTVRGRVRWRGDLFVTEGVGLAPGYTEKQADKARREADRRLLILIGQLRRNERPDRERERRTVRAQLEAYLAAGKPRMLEHSHDDYRRAAELRIYPFRLASVRMGELQPEHVDAWLADLAEAKATTHQARFAYDRLIECLRSFLADKGDQSFPGIQSILMGTRRRRPKHRKANTPALDEAEAARLLRHLTSGLVEEPYGSLFALQLPTWTRFSETAGLEWGKCHGLELFVRWLLDGEHGRSPDVSITVDQQLDRKTRRTRETKSEESDRVLPLHEWTARLLAGHYLRERARGRACAPNELVFVALKPPNKGPWKGKANAPLGYANARRKLADAAEAVCLTTGGKTHVLRATGATLASGAGVPANVLQGLLGHADPKTSLIYTRTRQKDLRAAVDGVGTSLFGTPDAR